MPSDGGRRHARRVQRRSTVIEAAAGVLTEEGLSAVTHRSVAARADMPLASTAYYFRTVEDLRYEALQHIAQAFSARTDAVVHALPAQLSARRAAQAVVRIIGADITRSQMLPFFERYLEAARTERLRSMVMVSKVRLVASVQEVLRRADLPSDEAMAGLVLALADGVAIHGLAEGTSPGAATVEALKQFFSLVATCMVQDSGRSVMHMVADQ
jgi:DNA-binding transcriptional regulator YbjK